MIEIKEVLRQWLAGVPKKRIAARVGLDPKTVRRYIARAEACGLSSSDGVDGLTDERLESVLVALKSPPEREPGESWRTCAEQQTFIEGHLAKGVTLTKIHRLLKRRGIAVPYSTLHRYASHELGFSRKPATVAIWCAQENGLRRHSTTQRLPKEHFEASEAEHLLPTPTERFDVPKWCEPKVARDHFAQVAGALYSLPTRLIGRRLRARADSKTVRFYDRGELVKAHTRQPKGGRSVDPNDFPAEKRGYAMRDVDFLKRQADEHGEAIGSYARALLDSPLPWTRMRTVYSLLRLVQKYGAAAVEKACAAALAVELIDVRRLRRLIEFDLPKPSTPTPKGALPLARYLRPAEQYALRGLSPANDNPSNEDKDKDAE